MQMLALVTFLFILSGFFFPLLVVFLSGEEYVFASLFWSIPLILGVCLYMRIQRQNKHYVFIVSSILMLLLYWIMISTYSATWVYLPLAVVFATLWFLIHCYHWRKSNR